MITVDEIHNTHGQSLTVGELRAYLEQFHDNVPVITYVSTDIFSASEEYANINMASVQGENATDAVVVLDVATVTDNRAW